VPVTYQIDPHSKTIRTKCVGHLTLPEVVEHFKALERDPECPERADVFLDLSEVSSLPETRQLSVVVTEMKKIRSKVRFEACAIVASRHALFGMMRMFETLAAELFRVSGTFRIATEAEAWLASQRSPAESEPPDETPG
jgi:hypothetical protein